MTSQTYQTTRYKKAKWLSLTVFMLCFVIAVSGFFCWIRGEVIAQAQQKVTTTLNRFDGVFASIDEMSLVLKRYRLFPCHKLRHMMTVQALQIPSSLAIEVKTPSGYCSSLDGHGNQAFFSMPQTKTLAFSTSDITSSTIYYRPNNDTVTKLNLPYFTEHLAIEPAYVHLSMQLAPGGSDDSSHQRVSSFGHSLVSSQYYPYSLIVTFQYTQMLQAIKFQLIIACLFIILIPWLLARQCYHLLLTPSYLAREIKLGIERGEFKAYVQPIMDSQHRVIYGEVLVRWLHPKYGYIPPHEFIELIENAHLASRLSSTLFTQVIAKLKAHIRTQDHDFYLSFNVSAQQLLTPQILNDCQRFIQAMDNKRIYLILELTDRGKVVNTEMMFNTYQELYNLGVRFAIDNVGVGKSSLFYIQIFIIDYIKIDNQFINLIGSQSIYSQAIINLLDLAKRLSIPSVAVGVENNEQFIYLQQSGIDYYQGYLFSKAIPVNDFINDWLK
ncbi:MAG: EAL domain-containing protein [Vibrio sp.]